MKKCIARSLVVISICGMGFLNNVFAQSSYRIADTKDIDMKLLGTSTLHKWEMNASRGEGDAQFGFKRGSETELTSLTRLSFTLEVEDLKSDSKGLDKNAYKALKSDDHKEIRYQLISATVAKEKGHYILKTQGNLTIAGVTKKIAMDVHCMINNDGTIACSGSDKLNMTDYNVSPPTFMLGAMKTGDEITLEFKVIYKKQKGA